MDIIIVCHTEFGFVAEKNVIFDKKSIAGAGEGVLNLIKIADKYGAKISFAVSPETAPYFPANINHEIGLHIHPGWQEFKTKNHHYFVGDKFLKENCNQSVDSTVLKDFSYKEQLEMIEKGKKYLELKLNVEPKIFVAGRWSLNNDTIKALIENGFTHDCSAVPHSKAIHHNWSNLPRICMPYRPSENDYQKKGNLPILMVPISQYFPHGNVNPEIVHQVGLQWLKACFLEYYKQGLPLFHICLHSPSMTDSYFCSQMDNLINFISKHKNVNFKFASEVKEYSPIKINTNIIPYVFGINNHILKTFFRNKVIKIKNNLTKIC